MTLWVKILPRHLTDRATALPHKAAAPTVRHRGSYGSIATDLRWSRNVRNASDSDHITTPH
jgi:hypothetical protein